MASSLKVSPNPKTEPDNVIVKAEMNDEGIKKLIIKLPAKFGDRLVTSPEELVKLLKKQQQDSQPEKNPLKKSPELLKCDSCEYSSFNRHYLKQHVDLVHSTERPFKCPFCDYAGKRSHALKEHLVVHSSYRPYQCHFCNASFRKKGHLTNHIRLHSSVNQSLVCLLCKTEVGSVGEIWQHYRQKHIGQAHKCQVCEYATCDAKEMKIHKWSHSKESVHHCTACDFSCAKELAMLEHIAEKHKGSAACTVCKRTSVQAEVFLKCSECGFATTNKDILKQHVLTHLSAEERKAYEDSQTAQSQKEQAQEFICRCGYKTSSATEMGEHAEKEHNATIIEQGSGEVVLEFPEGNSSLTSLELADTAEEKACDSPELNCGQCDFSTTEASVFITHMLSHRNRIKAGQEGSSRFHIDSMVPDKKQQHHGYVHDVAKGLYRCTICSYCCEHQRTIKAHTWKHSGHKDIDYPVFRNERQSSNFKAMNAEGNNEESSLEKSQSAETGKTTGKPRKVPATNTEVKNTEDSEPEKLVICEVDEMQVVEGGFVEEESESLDDSAESSDADQQTSEINHQPAADQSEMDREEAVKLFELLKRNGRQENETNDQKASGISASLLAAIEHVRQTGGELEEEKEDTKKKKRGRKRKAESPSDMENIEQLSKDQFRCNFCHYTSKTMPLMKLHMRVHKSKDKSQCSLCDFESSNAEELQIHMIKHCKMRTYQCKFCSVEFNYKSQLRAHQRAHEEGNQKQNVSIMCESCEFQTSDLSLYQQHLEKCRSQNLLCKTCDTLFLSNQELLQHKCREEEVFKCKECNFTSTSSESYNKHLRWHGRTYNCEHCDFSCTNYKWMSNHMRTHFEDREQRCKYCDFVAKSTRSLKSHMKRHANDQRFVQQPLEQYMCNLCGYVCHHLPSLKSHMWRHASDKKYSYVDTNQIINAAIDFDNKNPSDAENTTQNGAAQKKPLVSFSCCQCGFESSDKAALNDHMKEHKDIIQKTLAVNMGRLAFQTRQPEQK